MKNKILSLALSAVIILSAGLVGCSDSSGSTSSAEGEPKKEIVTVKLGLSDDTSKILWDPIVEEFKEKTSTLNMSFSAIIPSQMPRWPTAKLISIPSSITII